MTAETQHAKGENKERFRLVLAPMRGITNVHFRTVFARFFGGLDEAMAPFVPTVSAERIHPGLLRDLLPEENPPSLPLTPQLLGNRPADFLRMAETLRDMGYREINWNLGCPHKMVRRKGRGSGLLPHPDRIDAFLEQVCGRGGFAVSVKVRLGVEDPAELERLLPVLNRYPLARVVVHPRTAVQMYEGRADLAAFAALLPEIRHPVCYNGDIDTPAFFRELRRCFPAVREFMIGRGLLADPLLAERLRGEKAETAERERDRLRAFHDALVERYEVVLPGEQAVLGKMKELWGYLYRSLPAGRKLLKKIRRARRLAAYRRIVEEGWASASSAEA